MNFHRLIHSDWSLNPSGRATATAIRTGDRWHIDLPAPTGNLAHFVDALCTPGQDTLAGFDFPIGLPAAFGRATGLPSFPDALTRFGTGEWSDFFHVARSADQISPRRPFYPDAPGGRSHRQLLDGLGVDAITDLLRACERANPGRVAASPLFWTMGAKQVGKAAITGWRDVLRPARARGCRLWPFDGALAARGTVLAETYPAEAYAHVGLRFTAGTSKRRQSDRARFAPTLHAWAAGARIAFTPSLASTIDNGFGPNAEGENPFDALLGLLGMIEVVDGRRPDAPPGIDRVWEGWILGQHG